MQCPNAFRDSWEHYPPKHLVRTCKAWLPPVCGETSWSGGKHGTWQAWLQYPRHYILKKEVPRFLDSQTSVMSSKNTLGGEALGQRWECFQQYSPVQMTLVDRENHLKGRAHSPVYQGTGAQALVHSETKYYTLPASQVIFSGKGLSESPSLKDILLPPSFPPFFCLPWMKIYLFYNLCDLLWKK